MYTTFILKKGVPSINVAKSEVLFEQYRVDLHQDKYDIEIRNDNEIKRN